MIVGGEFSWVVVEFFDGLEEQEQGEALVFVGSLVDPWTIRKNKSREILNFGISKSMGFGGCKTCC